MNFFSLQPILAIVIFSLVGVLTVACNNYEDNALINTTSSNSLQTTGISQPTGDNFLQESDCLPPCWEGLTPGVSTRSEAEQVLHDLKQTETVIGFNCLEGGCMTGYYSNSSQKIITIFMEDSLVTSISGQINFALKTQDLIDLLGEPTFVYPISSGGCNSCSVKDSHGQSIDLPIHLIYPEQGAWFLALTGASRVGCICSDIDVVAFDFFPPMSIEETLDYLNDQGKLLDVQKNDLYKWNGFGPGYQP